MLVSKQFWISLDRYTFIPTEHNRVIKMNIRRRLFIYVGERVNLTHALLSIWSEPVQGTDWYLESKPRVTDMTGLLQIDPNTPNLAHNDWLRNDSDDPGNFQE